VKSSGYGHGWIEKEMADVKRSYEEEINLLEAETGELRSKLRQSGSYIAVMSKRFEDNMKAMYRPAGRGQASEGLALQFEQMSTSLENAHTEVQKLDKELSTEKTLSRRRHGLLVDDLTKALQGRDSALAALRRLEAFCRERGIEHNLVHETSNPSSSMHMDDIYGNKDRDSSNRSRDATRRDLNPNPYPSTYREGERERDVVPARGGLQSQPGVSSAVAQEEKRAIQSLMRGLVEADNELIESDRRALKRKENGSTPSSAEKTAVDERVVREREQERRDKEARDRDREKERALLERLKEERDRQDRVKASPGVRRDSKEGAGNMIALTNAHSSYGRESYTPLGPGTNPSSNYTSHNTGSYNTAAYSGLASPAMRYVSPLKRDSTPAPAPSVHTTPTMAHAPFVVRHASSDFISGVVESRVAGSPSHIGE